MKNRRTLIISSKCFVRRKFHYCSVCLCSARFAIPLNLIIQMQFDKQIFDGLIKSLCKLQPLCVLWLYCRLESSYFHLFDTSLNFIDSRLSPPVSISRARSHTHKRKRWDVEQIVSRCTALTSSPRLSIDRIAVHFNDFKWCWLLSRELSPAEWALSCEGVSVCARVRTLKIQ